MIHGCLDAYASTTSSRSSIPQSSTVTILDARSSDSADAAWSSCRAPTPHPGKMTLLSPVTQGFISSSILHRSWQVEGGVGGVGEGLGVAWMVAWWIGDVDLEGLGVWLEAGLLLFSTITPHSSSPEVWRFTSRQPIGSGATTSAGSFGATLGSCRCQISAHTQQWVDIENVI